jgi:hypothetical protein
MWNQERASVPRVGATKELDRVHPSYSQYGNPISVAMKYNPGLQVSDFKRETSHAGELPVDLVSGGD